MQSQYHFDYIIIGNGLAGLQLALAFAEDTYFDGHTMALIDPSEKKVNDKTWSFWEQGTGIWDDIVEKSWDTAIFKSEALTLTLPLKPYQYKTIRSVDFYRFAKYKLASKSRIQFILDEIESINESEVLEAVGKKGTYTAHHIFDSRIPKEFFGLPSKYTHIHQHFKGLLIEAEMPSFDPESFTMMDYRFQYKDSTSFIYVLPFSKTKALVEFTFFTPYTVAEHVYDDMIKAYLETELKVHDYKILETEVGNIPMTDFPFWDYNSPKITKIGTGGGWIKGSSGYSFKHTEKKVAKLIENIKRGAIPSENLYENKYKLYDQIFLNVLKNDNRKGPWIFERFYAKNSIPTMFRFLDEESTFSEDLKIMKSLFSATFVKEFLKLWFRF